MGVQFTEKPEGVEFSLKVVPGASRERVMGALGDALKVAVAAPPEAGAANRAVVRLLAGVLKVSPKCIEIIAGHSSPHKRIRVTSATLQHIQTMLGIDP